MVGLDDIISSKPARVSAAVPYGEKIELRELRRALEARPATGTIRSKSNLFLSKREKG